jgi:hypothetical protein
LRSTRCRSSPSWSAPAIWFLGGLLAGLVALNLTAAAYGADQADSCRRAGYGGLLAALPALLTGAACCDPSFLIVLGSGTAAALLPVVTPLRMLFYPLSLVLLAAALVWGTRRLESAAAINQHPLTTHPNIEGPERSDRRFGHPTEHHGC